MENIELVVPKIDNYKRQLRNSSNALEDASITLIHTLYLELDKIVPCGNDNRHELQLCAERGTIEDFGDYEEMLADGEIETREERENLWRSEYPEEKVWYHFVAVEYNGFRTVAVQHQYVIQINPHEKRPCGHDVTPFVKWLIQAVNYHRSTEREPSFAVITGASFPNINRTTLATYPQKTYKIF